MPSWVVCHPLTSLEKQVKAGPDVFGRRIGVHADGRRDPFCVCGGEGALPDPFVEGKLMFAPQKQFAPVVRSGQVSQQHGMGADSDGRCSPARHEAGAVVECSGRPDDVAGLAAWFGVNRQRLVPARPHRIEGRRHGRSCAADNRANIYWKAEQHVEDES